MAVSATNTIPDTAHGDVRDLAAGLNYEGTHPGIVFVAKRPFGLVRDRR